MNLVKVESRDELKKVLKKTKAATVVLASDIIQPEDVKGKFPVFKFGPILIPNTNILNEYLDNGISERYEAEYYKQLQKPNRLFLVNEVIYKALVSDTDLFFVISADEVEYQYLKMFNRFLRITYNCKMISAKKYLKGVPFQGDEDKLKKKLQEFRATLGNKLVDSGYVLYELLAIVVTKSSLKEYPKEAQRKIKDIIRGGN